jgi:steroid delta-isomerase-like uncharacterized protein
MRGIVESIHIAPTASVPMQPVSSVLAIAGQGLDGDRYARKIGTYPPDERVGREITLIEAEAVEALNAGLGTQFSAGEMRRNVVTRGVALNHLVGREFMVGEVRLRGIRLCEPCEHLSSLTHKNVITVMLHRCGLRTQMVNGGTIHVGDAIILLDSIEEKNKELIRRYYAEMWNEWNFDLAKEILAPGIAFRGSLGTETRGRAAFCDYMRKVRAAFPDFHNAIENIVAENDQVVARLTYTGTHEGEIFGVAPTHRKMSYSGAAFFRIRDGQVAEGWVLGDIFGLLKSLGTGELADTGTRAQESANTR